MADTHGAPPKQRNTMKAANILAIVGSIILIIIIIWGLIHLLSLSGGFFSGLFGGSNDSKITVTAPAQMSSGVASSISWKFSTDERGTYAIIYPCTEGLRFATQGTGGALVTMPCGAAFTLGQSTTSASILPMLVGSTTVRTPLSVLFLPSSTSTAPAEGTVTIAVNPSSNTPVVPEPTEPEPAEPTTPKPVPSTPVSTGPADLVVTITSVNVDAYGNGIAVFHISNIGGSATDSYYFTAQLPTLQPYTYVSPAQASLSPGSYIVNTLRFTQATIGNVHVAVDTTNAVAEKSEYNNTDSEYVSSGYNYNYQYPYQYPIY